MSKQSDIVKVSQDAGTTGFVNVTGDTMTGALAVQKSDASVYNAVQMDNTYAAGITAGAAITWQQSGNVKSSIEANTYGLDYMSIRVGGNTERMRIDNAGRVTMPYQPAFHAQKNDAGNNNVTGNVIFNNAPQNIGGHYNTSNGRFTAPISGTYFFTVSVMKGSANGYGLYQVIKNGAVTVLPASGFVQGYTYSIANDGMTNISGSVFLNAGDYVTVFVSATYPSFYWGGYNVFSGFLVG